MAQPRVFSKKELQLTEALAAAAKRARREARKEQKSLMALMSPICEITIELPSLYLYTSSDVLRYAIEESEAKEEKASRNYRKAVKIIHNIAKSYWIERIRFSDRSIGNLYDLSLEMIATPPTSKPADEIMVTNVLNFHQQGGDLDVCLS